MLVIALSAMLAFFAIAQLRILVIHCYSRAKGVGRQANELTRPTSCYWPTVVVQLPVYREHKVLHRLLTAVTNLDYADGRLAVQVLDDSEGEEAALAKAIVDAHRGGSVAIEYVHRESRDGYKSGALNHGMRMVDCDLVAIFDADFTPDRDFLIRTVPLFEDARVGAVHTRWRHRNGLSSPLTLLQAAVLDSLFCFSSGLRQARGESTMYLGTSGVWRKRTIEDLDGWREAPFTDDGIDLSFRAQLAGWSVIFVNEALASSDLPDTYISYKNQQRRWARAAFRLFLDYGKKALRPPQGKRRRFLELSSLHLVLATPVLVLTGLLSSAYVVLGLPRTPYWAITQIGLSAFVVLFPPLQECVLSQRMLYDDWARRCLRLPLSLPLAIGVSVSVLAGFRDTVKRDEPEFVRTPKEGSSGVIRKSEAKWVGTASRIAWCELGLGVVFLTAGLLSIVHGYPESCFLLLSLAAAFLVASARSGSEIRRAGHRPAIPASARTSD
ncbi:glycosyltransferase [Kitasatospora sp. NPDC053057]|uniref:glycosyltransferase n=1 Tax=Kitasatospora sp. NPDC053057 TaxID=3364062 RepID=UPI0037C7896B